MYKIKPIIGDYLLYVGQTSFKRGYTNNKRYLITYVDDNMNVYFQDDNGMGTIYDIRTIYHDDEWKYLTIKDIRKIKLNLMFNGH